MNDIINVKQWVEETYNQYISVYDYGDTIRVTNGSAAMYADIRLKDGSLFVSGERYRETFKRKCDPNKDALLETLGETLGL
jgi:hypothetical protein